MSFLSPWFLLGMLAVGVPIALHLLARERTTDVRLPTWRFLDQAPVEQTRRRRLTDLLLLALRAAAVVLLAWLFARPFLPGLADDPLLVVAVDTSASMSAPATWQSARDAVERRLGSRERRGRIALVTFDHVVQTVVEPTSDTASILRALSEVSPHGGRGNLEALVAFVAGTWPAEPVTLLVVSDFQQDEALPQPLVRPALVDVVVERAEPARENVSVEDVSRRTGGVDIVVRNHGDAARPVTVSVDVDRTPVSSVPVELAPGESARVPVEVDWPRAGMVIARVDDATGILADNARGMVLDPVPPLPVTLVLTRSGDPAGRYLVDALAAAPANTVFDVRSVESGDATALGAALDATGAGEVVVVASTRGLDRSLAGAFAGVLNRGGGVLGLAGPDVDVPILLDALSLGGRVRFIGRAETPSALLPDDVRHPVLAAFGPLVENLARVDVRRWVELVPGDEARTVARLSGGRPALVDLPAGPGRLMLLATDLGRAWNDFPVEPVFVPFVIETMRYLSNRRDVPAEMTAADAGNMATTVPGVISMGQPPRRVAVNPDRRESRLQFDRVEDVRARVTTGPAEHAGRAGLAQVTERGQGLWRYVLLALAVVLAGEAWLAGRGRSRAGAIGGTA